MTTIELRDYQVKAIEAVHEAWADGIKCAAVLAATGAGKTVIFAHMIAVWLVANPGRRAVVLVHRDELATQTVKKVRDEDPNLSVGIVKAKLDETGASVVVGSVQTLMRPGRVERIKDVGMVVCDECHHAAAKGWRAVMERLGCFRKDGPLTVGFTATMVRSDELKLSTVWDKVVANVDILTLIKAGHLCDVRAKSMEIDGLDLATVAKRGGDFADGSLGEALEGTNADEGIVKAYIEHGEGRQSVLFAPTVRFATTCARAFDAAGIPSAVITGATKPEERDRIYAEYRAGRITVLCNCMVLTEGWDMPQASCLIVARPTQHQGLYIQMVGRVLRPFPGKVDALILDVVGATTNNSLIGVCDLSDELVKPQDGESLLEAIERARKERRRGGPLPLHSMTAREVRLFGEGEANWLQTDKGVWFLRSRRTLWVLWAYGDTYRVLRHDQSSGQTVVLARDLSMEEAIDRAAKEALWQDRLTTCKRRPWRKKDASPATGALARTLGLKPGDMRGGDVSNLIDVCLASRIIDPKVKEMAE
jgi:superfamily II DNA or RNA helicase